MVGAAREVMSQSASSRSATTSGPSSGAHTRPTKHPALPLNPVVSTSAFSSLFASAEDRTGRAQNAGMRRSLGYSAPTTCWIVTARTI